MTLLHENQLFRCDCDALLRATSADPAPFHRPGCRTLLCPECGQPRVAHAIGVRGVLTCPDGRGVQ